MASWSKALKAFPSAIKTVHPLCLSQQSRLVNQQLLKCSAAASVCLRPASTSTLPPAKLGKAASSDEKMQFLKLLPDLVRELTHVPDTDIPEAWKWYSKVIQYNVTGGKMNRGLAVAMSYRLLAQPEDLTEENIKLAYVLGWCIELLQTFFLVTDDVIDGSSTRRGRPAWHVKDNRGMSAFNDAILVEAGVYRLLKNYISDKPYYVEIMDLFHSITLKTALGQTLDLESNTTDNKPDFKKFTMDRYNNIIRYKTGYYSFYLPVAVAMHMSGITDAELHRQARTILLEMGSFFQVQDDYLDCFGDSTLTGKVGTDIGEGKCTWLAVVALQRASKAQKRIMEQHYGDTSAESVAAITQLYKDLGLPATYRQYEDSTSSLIRMHIQQISRGLNHKVFFKFLDKIHRRSS